MRRLCIHVLPWSSLLWGCSSLRALIGILISGTESEDQWRVCSDVWWLRFRFCYITGYFAGNPDLDWLWDHLCDGVAEQAREIKQKARGSALAVLPEVPALGSSVTMKYRYDMANFHGTIGA